ncbi:MAG: hypothetical protein WC527_00645 [Candidatus Margulisiibacteriota bacterium]
MGKTKTLLLAAIFSLGLFSDCYAIDPIISWVRLPVGFLPPIISYSTRQTGAQESNIPRAGLDSIENNFMALMPLSTGNKSDLGAVIMYKTRIQQTDAVIPSNGIKIPEKLNNLLAGSVYKKTFDNGWTAGLAALLGSASDKLFYSKNQIVVRTDAYLKVPSNGENSWLYYIDYNNNRSFWRSYPIPGAGYWFKPAENLEAILGLPLLYANFCPTKNWGMNVLYIFPTQVQSRIEYGLTPQLTAYGAFEWGGDIFAPSDWDKPSSRLCYYEKTLEAGLHWQFMQYSGLDISAGYAFDRYYSEAEGFSDRQINSVPFKNAAFFQLRAGFPF